MEKSVCLVCLGNICRSPTAEAVLRHLINARRDAQEWQLDSCGTGAWHVGNPPDARARKALARRRYACDHRARQLDDQDYQRFAWLLAMDDANMADIQARSPAHPRARICKLTAWDPHGTNEVSDPYYGGEDGFTQVLDQVERCCAAFLAAEYPD